MPIVLSDGTNNKKYTTVVITNAVSHSPGKPMVTNAGPRAKAHVAITLANIYITASI